MAMEVFSGRGRRTGAPKVPRASPKTTGAEEDRVNKRDYIAAVARRSGLPIKTVSAVYEAGIEELLETIASGKQLTLMNFGKFYLQWHKGHRVRFRDEGADAISDYPVLKFSATPALNRGLDCRGRQYEADQAAAA